MRRGLGIASTAIAAFSLCPAIATAQDAASLAIDRRLDIAYPAPDPARLSPILRSAMSRSATASHLCEPAALAIAGTRPATADQIVIGQIARRGAHNGWVVTARPSGCEEHATLRFLVVEAADGTLQASLFGVGESLAWPSLVRDTQIGAMIAATRALPDRPDCAQASPRLADEAIVTRDKDLAMPSYGVVFHGGWRERWTYRRCGRPAPVLIDFQADGNGGASYHIAAAG